MLQKFGKKRIAVLIFLWVYLAMLVLLARAVDSPIMRIVFNVGWVSMFLTGGFFLYRQYQELKGRMRR